MTIINGQNFARGQPPAVRKLDTRSRYITVRPEGYTFDAPKEETLSDYLTCFCNFESLEMSPENDQQLIVRFKECWPVEHLMCNQREIGEIRLVEMK